MEELDTEIYRFPVDYTKQGRLVCGTIVVSQSKKEYVQKLGDKMEEIFEPFDRSSISPKLVALYRKHNDLFIYFPKFVRWINDKQFLERLKNQLPDLQANTDKKGKER